MQIVKERIAAERTLHGVAWFSIPATRTSQFFQVSAKSAKIPDVLRGALGSTPVILIARPVTCL
jgi:hypothetical protein